MEEVWKEIDGYEGYYEVSNLGNIRSMNRIIYKSDGTIQTYKSKPIAIRYNKRVNMYETYLSKNGKKKCCKIHRLVAQAFCYNDDPSIKTTVNHIDGDRSNNTAINLEWVSYGDNEKHKSIAEASRYTGISETQIRRIANDECVNNNYNFILEEY